MTRAVRIAAALTAVVALGSGVLSWDALRWGAGQLGVDEHLTWIYPIVLDGMIGVGTVAALALRGARRRIRAYVWGLLGGAIGASVVGNAAHAAGGNPLHVVGSAVPAVALAASLHLLVILVRESQPVKVPAKVPSPTPAAKAKRGSGGRRIRVLQQQAAVSGQKLTGAAMAKATGVTRQYANRVLRSLDPEGT
jgi:uncharacterized protein DUF2637